jgi:hypothetical protein
MDAVKFVKERRRMYTLGCIKKGINDYNTKAEDVVAEVEEWSTAHPCKTRQSVFLKQYPNAVLDKDGVLRICPPFVGGDIPEKYKCICLTDCSACRREFWMQEVE